MATPPFTSSTPPPKKLILVIGATGAQGMEVVPALLAPCEDGSPSPYAVRALTRDPENRRAKELKAMGAELFQGSFYDLETMAKAFDGCYGAFVNTDTYTVGEEKEIWSAVQLYTIARRTPSMRHFVWSNLDYGSKLGDFDPIYKSEHHDAKGIFNDYLHNQPSFVNDKLTWTSLTSCVYYEMLLYPLCGPLNIREDGTVVFATPLGDGHIPMISLADLGWWNRHVLNNREEHSGKELLVASDWVSWDYLVETFTKVTGKPAVYRRLSLDQWFACMSGHDRPIANEKTIGDGSTTIRQSFSGFWCLWRDDMIKRDMEWIRSVHPKSLSVGDWMKKIGYTGVIGAKALKNAEDGKGRVVPNKTVTSLL